MVKVAVIQSGGLLSGFKKEADRPTNEKELIDYLETGKANGFKDLLENYFPRMWNLDAITKYPEQFKAIIFDCK